MNDLLTNTAGAVLGYLIVRILLRRREDVLPGGESTVREFAALAALTFGIAFLIQPFISGALWNLIYT